MNSENNLKNIKNSKFEIPKIMENSGQNENIIQDL